MSDITLAINIQADMAVDSIRRVSSALDGLSSSGTRWFDTQDRINQGGRGDAFAQMSQQMGQINSAFDQLTSLITAQTAAIRDSISAISASRNAQKVDIAARTQELRDFNEFRMSIERRAFDEEQKLNEAELANFKRIMAEERAEAERTGAIFGQYRAVSKETIEQTNAQAAATKAKMAASKEAAVQDSSANDIMFRLTSAMKTADAAQAELTNKKLAGLAAGKSLKEIEEELADSHKKSGDAAAINGGQLRELAVIMHEIGTGNTSRVFGSMWVLFAERGFDAKAAFKAAGNSLAEIGPISILAGTGVAAAGIAFAAATVRAAALSAQVREMSVLMKGFSAPGMNISPEQLQQMTMNATKYGASRSDLGGAADQLLRDPAISKNLYQPILDSTAGVAAMMGTDIPQAAQKMIDAVKGGVRGVFDLSDAFGGKLSPAMMQTMMDMERAGKGTEAVAMGMDALTGSMKNAANEMRSDLGQALHEVGDNLDKIITTISGWAIVTVPLQTLAASLGEVASLMKAITEGDFTEAMRHISVNGGQTVAMIEGAQKAALAKAANDAGSFDSATMPGSVATASSGNLSALTKEKDAFSQLTNAMHGDSAERDESIAKMNFMTQASDMVAKGLLRQGDAIEYVKTKMQGWHLSQDVATQDQINRLHVEEDFQRKLNAASGNEKKTAQIQVERAGALAVLGRDPNNPLTGVLRDAAASAEATRLAAPKTGGSTTAPDNQIQKLENQVQYQRDLNDAMATGNLAKVHEVELSKQISDAQVGEKQGREDQIAALIREADAQKQLNALSKINNDQSAQLRAVNQNIAYLGMGQDQAARAKAENDIIEKYRLQGVDLANMTDQQKTMLQTALHQADAIANQTIAYEQQKVALDELGKFGDQVFDRMGTAITQAFTQGNGAAINFKSILQGIESEIIQEMVKLAAINPIKNMISGGSNLATIGGVFSAVSGGASSGQGMIQLVGGSTPGTMTSTGGGSYGGGITANSFNAYSSGGSGSGVQTLVPNGQGGFSLQSVGSLASAYNAINGGGISSLVGSIDQWGVSALGIGSVGTAVPASMLSAGSAAEFGAAMNAAPVTDAVTNGMGVSGGLSSFATGAGGALGIGMGINSLLNSNGSAGSIIGGAGQVIGGGMALASLLPGMAALGPWGIGVGVAASLISSLFGEGSSHGPSADARIFSGNIGSGLPLAPSSDAWLASSQNYPNYLDMMAGAGHLIKPEAGWNPNHLYADQTGEQHRNGDLTGTLSQTQAFANNFNAMMDQYNLTLSKQWIGLLTSGDNSNPGYGSTDAMLLGLANSGAISGAGAIGSVFTNAPNTKFTQSKDLQSALQFAKGIDDTLFSQNNNQYAVNARNLTSSYQSNLTQAAQYGVDTTYIDQAYAEQTKRNTQDQGMAQLKTDSSLDARQAALNGNTVAQVQDTLKVQQAEEMLAAERDHMTDTTKLAAIQQQEYAKAIEQATVKMQSANTAIYSQGMSYLGQTIPAAFATIAANSNAAILSAQQNGQDVATAQAVQNVTNFRSQIQAILSTATTQAQQLQSYLQQSGALRDTATAMGDARLTPQQAYDTAISRWRTDLAAAQGGDLDALSKLTSYGQAAVNAESSVSGGTQTTIYNEVTAGLNSMADQVDQQNGINATDAKQQLNQLQTLVIAANKQLTATQTSADDLKSYFDTAVSNENSALSALSSLQSTMQAGFDGLINVTASSQVSSIQAAAVKATDTINNLTASSTPAGPVPRTSDTSSSSSSSASSSTPWSGLSAIELRSFKAMGASEDNIYWSMADLPALNAFAAAGYPGYANGTDFAPGGWSMVGERGPEMMYVPRGSTVVPTGGDPNAAIVAELQEMRKLLAAVGLRLADTGAANVDATNRLGVGLQTAAYRPVAMSNAA